MDPSEYKPQPVDTSAIELDEDLQDRIEALAINNHEVWAQARVAEGWRYGPERNDARKEHPGLVPYEQLSEAEKEIDRGTVVQTLKAAVALGVKFQPDEDLTKSGGEEVSGGPEDDISEWPAWPRRISGDAAEALNKVRDEIGRVYQAADGSAGTNLYWHRRVAFTLAVFGGLAVGVAIFQLYENSRIHEWAARLEFACTLAAFIAVVLGVWAGFMGKWLVRRHRAERCRFLKFDLLLDVALAARDHDRLVNAARRCRERADKIALLDRYQMEEWLEEEQVLTKPPAVSEGGLVLTDMRALAEHYLRTRLEVQTRYFFKQSSRDARWNWQSQNLAPLLLGGSIFFSMIHFALESFPNRWESSSRLFILLAALLPVAGWSIRALRGISEYSRNTLRFKAKYNALKDLIRELEEELSGQTKAGEIERLLWKGEQILEGEHREWLRLMIEIEWVG